MKREYILGFEEIPYWLNKKIMQYRKNNGSIGYMFYGKNKTLYLNKGDKIYQENGVFKFKRKGYQFESRRFFKSSKKVGQVN